MNNYRIPTEREEGVLVKLAKEGDFRATRWLFCAYLPKIREAWNFSPKGTHPKKFGYGYNPRGVHFEDVAGKILLFFRKTILAFDPAMVSERRHSKNNPFLEFVLNKMVYFALDEVRNEQKRESRFERLEDFQEILGIDKGIQLIHSKNLVKFLLNKYKKQSKERKVMEAILKEKNSNSITDVAKETGMTRTTVYNVLDRIKTAMPT